MPPAAAALAYPVAIHVDQALSGRNRLTAVFRIILAIPHLLLVGSPLAVTLSWPWTAEGDYRWGAGGGVLGAAMVIVTLIAWFAILFTGRHPSGLWTLAAFYLRWRVRAVAYMALFRDEYPPFGDGPYPVWLDVRPPDAPRDRLRVFLRLILALPHILVVWVLGLAWALTTFIAWLAILFSGRYPAPLYTFGIGVFRWSTRLEAYLLLLGDEYPPFSLS